MTNEPEQSLRMFGLYQDSNRNRLGTLVAVVIPPEPVSHETVEIAWAYAVMYSAKGLTIPDWEGAVKLLKKRHPSWQVIGYEFIPVGLNLSKADEDVSEQEPINDE